MKHVTRIAAFATTIFLSAALAAVSAPNIYGEGGLIEIPDDTTYAVGSIVPAYHGVYSVSDAGDQSFNFFTAGTGILPNLSVSAGAVTNGGTDLLLNGKYRIYPETSKGPSVTIGVLDATGAISRDGNPGFYVVVGKSLTSVAEEVAGTSKPLRGYIGAGTGVLKGFFVGLDWKLAPKLSAMVEYIGSDEGLTDESHFNAGIRYALTNELRVDLGTYAFKSFTAGISYTAIRF